MKLALVGRAVACVAVVGAGVLAWRAGGGADAPASPPRAVASAAGSSAPVGKQAARGAAGSGERAGAPPPGVGGYDVALRLVEAMKDARVDAPSLTASEGVLRAHWRRLKPPFAGVGSTAIR